MSQTRNGARLEAMLDSRREVKVTERGNSVEIEVTRVVGVTTVRTEIIRLFLPAGIKLELESGSGSVKVTGIEFDELQIDVGSGSIELSGSRGPMRLSAGSGDIDVTDSGGDKNLGTGSGSISVRGSDGDIRANSASGSQNYHSIKGDIEANTGSGAIELDNVEGVLTISAGSGDVSGESITLTGDSSFTTASGRIDLALRNSDDELSFDLDAGSGNIRVGDIRGADRVIYGSGDIKVTGRSGSGDQEYKIR